MTYIPDCSSNTLSQAAGQDCPEITGQIVGMALYIKGSGATFANLAAIQTESNWNTNASSNGLVYTPAFGQGLTIPGSERNEAGRDTNESLFGTGILNGRNTVTVTGIFHNLDYATIVALDTYTRQSVFTPTRLLAYFIIEGKTATSGRVKASTDGTTYSGFEIFNWSVGSKNLQGFNSQDMTTVDFVLKGNWDRTAEIVDGMDFNPIEKLVGVPGASS